jgi:hypothetical protein
LAAGSCVPAYAQADYLTKPAWRKGEYRADEEELGAMDEAIAELDRGGVASEAQVRAAYAKSHGA